jgi:hypothetical protein
MFIRPNQTWHSWSVAQHREAVSKSIVEQRSLLMTLSGVDAEQERPKR